MLSKKRSQQPLTETLYDNQELIDKVRQHDTHISKQITDLKEKIRKTGNGRREKTADLIKTDTGRKEKTADLIKTDTGRKEKTADLTKATLTKAADLVEHNDVTVTRLLSKRFSTRFNTENYQRSIRDLHIALMTLSGLTVIVSLGWMFLSKTNFLVNSNFAYNVGLLGGFLMLCSIFYALLKRIKFINALGKNETWYYAHLVCGIVGPLLILFHTSFHIKSINSAVASFTLFIILISGLFGRYIFTLLSYQAHRVYLEISEIELSLLSDLYQHRCSTTKKIKTSLTRLTVNGLKKPKTWWWNFPQMIKVPLLAISFYRTFKRDIRKLYDQIAQHEAWEKRERRKKRRANKKIARRYARKILWLSILSMSSNLLQNWRTFHANMMYLLILTATGHIIAVHMY